MNENRYVSIDVSDDSPHNLDPVDTHLFLHEDLFVEVVVQADTCVHSAFVQFDDPERPTCAPFDPDAILESVS